MIHYDPSIIAHRDFHQILLSGVAPRPIAFVSSVNASGQVNLAPFSFFNSFASKPPVVAIGPAIAAASGREKDTLLNILQTGQCTISMVSHSFVHQMNLASTDYEYGVDEYVKSGLTKCMGDVVPVPYVAESCFSMECELIQNIELFRELGGNGNIMLLKVLRLHVKEEVMTEGKIDPRKMDLVARMGYKWYARIRAEDCFEAAQPRSRGMGMDQLPEHIRLSTVLSANDCARLAMAPSVPSPNSSFSLDSCVRSMRIQLPDELVPELNAILRGIGEGDDSLVKHRAARLCLQLDRIDDAWQCLL